MSRVWPTVALKDVLYLNIDAVKVDPAASYPIAGVYSFGRGLLARSPILGMQTTYKVLHRLHKDDFVLSQLKGWEGALSRIPDTFDGWFLSPQFPMFRTVSDRLDICYLDWYCKRAKVWEDLKRKSQGMGARRDSISPAQFLSLTIPLPPLSEQRRIVARIEELAARIEEASGLRQEAVEEAREIEKLATRAMLKNLNNASSLSLRQLITLRGGGTPSKSNPSFWEGKIPWISPKDMKIREINDATDHISEEATIESSAKLLGPGAVLIVVRGMILAHTVPSAVLRVLASINQDMKALITDERLLPQYLCSVFWGLNNELLELVEKSTHDTRKLETTKLLDFMVPVPSLSEQHHIVAYLDDLRSKVDSLKQLQSETSAEIDALLPSILDKAFKGEL